MWRSGWLCICVFAMVLGGCGGGSTSHKTASVRKHCVATIVGVNINGTGPLVPPVRLRKQCVLSGGAVLALPPGPTRGKTLIATSGCLACHRIGGSGNSAPGENLSGVGAALSRAQIERALIHPEPPMPSFKALGSAKLKAVVAYLAQLRRGSRVKAFPARQRFLAALQR